jgi:hypothetical protein
MTATARILEIDRQAQWAQRKEQGAVWEGRQARRIWAVEALKAELLPEEWDAASRAVKDCAAAFDGMCRVHAERTDGGGGSDYGLAAQISAVRCLEGLRQAALTRTKAVRALDCVEWIVQLYTLPEMARELGVWRSRGADREREPDTRPVKPFVRLVLISMAGYYDACSAELARCG